MIKKIFLPFIILLICFLLVINYLSYKSPTETKLITQQKAYSLSGDTNLKILMYTNRKTAYQEKEAFDVVFLCDFDETKKLNLKLLNISKSSKYEYLKEKYQEYQYTFKLPILNADFFIEEAYLYIRLKNGNEQKFKVGSFDYYYIEELLNITELFGKRYADFPTLESVSIRFSLTEDIYINNIILTKNLFTYVGKTVTDNELITINFDKLDKITDELTIKIDYHINGEQYESITPYFIFYETFENPLIYGVLNNVYLLDWNKKPF